MTQPFIGGGGGGSSGGGGGGGGAPGGGAPSDIGGFSDQALQSLMNNPDLPPEDRVLAMASETLRRDPNAFNGALKTIVDQALGQGANTQAVGGGIGALVGAVGAAPGQATVTPLGGPSAPPVPRPAPAGNAIMELVQQFVQTVDSVLPKR